MDSLKLYNWNYSFGIYDFDSNILNTDTPLYFKNKITGKIEQIPGHISDQNPEIFYGKNSIYEVIHETYSESRDFFGVNFHRGFNWLSEDTLKSIENGDFAPSFNAFKDVYLVKARIFAILTARGNSADNFQNIFHLINESVLNQEEKEEQFENIIKNFNLPKNISRTEALYNYLWFYTNYIPCNNPQIEKIMWFENMRSADRKAKAMDFLIPYYIKTLEKIYKKQISEIIPENNSLSIWFSDDSLENIVAVYDKFQDILNQENFYPDISKKFSVYFSGKIEQRDLLLTKLKNKNFEILDRDLDLKIKLKKS